MRKPNKKGAAMRRPFLFFAYTQSNAEGRFTRTPAYM